MFNMNSFIKFTLLVYVSFSSSESFLGNPNQTILSNLTSIDHLTNVHPEPMFAHPDNLNFDELTQKYLSSRNAEVKIKLGEELEKLWKLHPDKMESEHKYALARYYKDKARTNAKRGRDKISAEYIFNAAELMGEAAQGNSAYKKEYNNVKQECIKMHLTLYHSLKRQAQLEKAENKRQKQFEKAAKIITKLFDKFPNDSSEVWVESINIYSALGDVEKVVEIIDRLSSMSLEDEISQKVLNEIYRAKLLGVAPENMLKHIRNSAYNFIMEKANLSPKVGAPKIKLFPLHYSDYQHRGTISQISQRAYCANYLLFNFEFGSEFVDWKMRESSLKLTLSFESFLLDNRSKVEGQQLKPDEASELKTHLLNALFDIEVFVESQKNNLLDPLDPKTIKAHFEEMLKILKPYNTPSVKRSLKHNIKILNTHTGTDLLANIKYIHGIMDIFEEEKKSYLSDLIGSASNSVYSFFFGSDHQVGSGENEEKENTPVLQ